MFHGIPTVGHSRQPRSAFQISDLHFKHKYFANVCRHKNACANEMQTPSSPQMNFLHMQTNHIYFENLAVSPSSERRRANGRNVSFPISVRWSIYIINSVDKPNFRISLPHRRSTTVSIETNPLYSYLFWFAIFVQCTLR